MIVVSNTSPLTNLAAIGQFELLQHLFTQIHISEGVWAELNAGGKQWPGANEVSGCDWVLRHTTNDQRLVTALRRDLDLGESESIALAMELGADIILLDEREARHTAQALHLRMLGTGGILLDAKEQGLVERVEPLLADLRHVAGFYLSEALYKAILTAAGESETP